MAYRRFASAEAYGDADAMDYLADRIARLACHQGFVHAEVLSDKLRRFLPHRRSVEAENHYSEARQQLRSANLEHRTLAYLIHNVDCEIELATSRIGVP